jgi:peptidoglycan/LPS O-acetylase OafA/YrhL
LSFFIVSGFVISEATDTFYKNNFKKYIYNRFLKIYPTYWIVTIICFILYPLLDMSKVSDIPKVNFSLSSLFANITLLPAYLKYFNNLVLLSQTWAVIVEFQFYIIIGMIIILFKKNKYLISSFCLLTLILYLIILINDLQKRFFGFFEFSPYFFYGAFLYFYLNGNKKLLLPIIISLLLITHNYFTYNIRDIRIDLEGWEDIFDLSITIILPLVLFVITIYTFNYLLTLKVDAKFKKIDIFFGSITYALYLVHMPVVALIANFKLEFPLLSYLCILFISILLSIVIQYISEKPLENLRNKIRNYKLYD